MIHDFWVPNLARKMDAVPGRRGLHLAGGGRVPVTYAGTCSEFCGAQHAWMRFRVIAEPEPNFEAWLTRQAQPSPEPTGIAAEGARLFQSKKCADCHAVSAIDASAAERARTWRTWPAAKPWAAAFRATTPESSDALADQSASRQAWQSHAGYAADRRMSATRCWLTWRVCK